MIAQTNYLENTYFDTDILCEPYPIEVKTLFHINELQKRRVNKRIR